MIRIRKVLVKIFNFMRTGCVRLAGFFRSRGLLLSKNSRALAAYKDKHKGQRCFLVGNGASLRPEDLDKIKNEVSFGCNRIYRLFGETGWRPEYYCVVDQVFAKAIAAEYPDEGMKLFLSHRAYVRTKPRPKDTVYIWGTGYIPDFRAHVDLLAYYIPSYATVMTLMIQLAMYMGFSEIYLLGVDCTNSNAKGAHFSSDYFTEEMKATEQRRARNNMGDIPDAVEKYGQWMTEKSQAAYRVLREYADGHGYKIWNATRGGMLEAFPRVDLDDVLSQPDVAKQGDLRYDTV